MFFVRHAWSACAWGIVKQVLCDRLLVDFDAVFCAFFQNGWFFQMHYIVLIFVARWRHNFREIAVKIAKSPKIGRKVCAHHFAVAYLGGALCEAPLAGPP